MTLRAVLLLAPCLLFAAEMIGSREARVDSEGRLLPVQAAKPSQAFDRVIRMLWQCEQSANPFRTQDSIDLLAAGQLFFEYTGDAGVHRRMREAVDRLLAHGLSDPNLPWGGLPYPDELQPNSGQLDGDRVAGKGFLRPDQAASFGAELVSLYKTSGEKKYLDAARKIADTLAAQVRDGSGERSPWPFRVNAASGDVYWRMSGGRAVSDEYTAGWTGALRLFDELIEMKIGAREGYGRARRLTGAWLKQYPLQNGRWGSASDFDVPGEPAYAAVNGHLLAAYLMAHPEFDPQWSGDAFAILRREWLALKDAAVSERWGIQAIRGRARDAAANPVDTARQSALELVFCAQSGSCGQRERAVRGLIWASYFVGDGCGGDRVAGGADLIRDYLRAMSAAPELAPDGETHLLRSSSVIRSVEYGERSVTYEKFDAHSSERLKLGAWAPGKISGGSIVRWDPATRLVVVQTTKRVVTITGE